MRTILIDMPCKCRGYIYEDMVTGEKCCVLNARLSYETNMETYRHEMEHDINNDLENSLDVNAVEVLRHKK